MAFEGSQSERIQKPKKIGSASAIVVYSSHLEDFSAVPKDQTTSSASIINHHNNLREWLETLTSFALTNINCRGLGER